MSALPEPYVTVEEYLAAERNAETKSEYLDGYLYAMAGGTPRHSAIAMNVAIELGIQLRDKSCQVYNSDLMVATSPTGLYAYPDVSVVCGEPRFQDNHPDALTNPLLIVEVLSPKTEDRDRGPKFVHYRRIDSLIDYLLVVQDEPYVDHYQRQSGDRW